MFNKKISLDKNAKFFIRQESKSIVSDDPAYYQGIETIVVISYKLFRSGPEWLVTSEQYVLDRVDISTFKE